MALKGHQLVINLGKPGGALQICQEIRHSRNPSVPGLLYNGVADTTRTECM
jgi:hypothetical protein